MYGFDNEDLVATLFRLDISKLILEVSHLTRKLPRLREKIVIILEGLLHSHQISTKIILPRKLIHPCEVVYPLVILQFRKLIG
jgi:hypothetical protein